MDEENLLTRWWDWMALPGPSAGATWIGTALSAIGLAITIVGFWNTVRAARAARIEAGAAKDQAKIAGERAGSANQHALAAVAAIEKLKQSLGASSLAYMHSQIGLLGRFVADQHYDPAYILLATIERDMLHHAADTQISQNDVRDLKARLKLVSSHIGYAQSGDTKFKPDKLRETVRTIQQTIVEWEIPIRKTAGEV